MSEPVTLKRKRDEDSRTLTSAKRLCKDVASPPSHLEPVTSEPKSKKPVAAINSNAETPINAVASNSSGGKAAGRNATKVPFKPRPKIVKLSPHRPYPSVPTSSSATGPRSKRKEGNNKICVTRRTDLGAYLSRCKDLFVKEGYTELYLAAMGAAIPHAVTLATSLPAILPYHRREIKTSVTTGSVKVTDEVVPVNDEDEDEVRTRIKASVEIIIRIQPEQEIEVRTADQEMEYDSFSE